MQHQGIRTPAAPDIRHFNLALLSTRAALAGEGIALSNDFVAGSLVATGALMSLKQFSYSLPWGQYYLHHRTSSHNADQISIFIDWMVAAAVGE